LLLYVFRAELFEQRTELARLEAGVGFFKNRHEAVFGRARQAARRWLARPETRQNEEGKDSG